jgi:LysR family transcriptional regulator, glycine cleavage system transcriptional activator
MAKRLPSLDALRVLAVCARYGNFSRAAGELGITPTAVSQRVRGLEAELGVKLFRRHGPTLITTDRAKALGQRVDQALAQIRAAVDECRRVKQPLRVTCAPTFAARWLMPRLAAYHTIPEAKALVLDNSQTLLPAGSFDVAIRSGAGPWPGYRCARLMAERRTPLLSPRWAGQRLTARRLLELPLIPDSGWSEWFKLAGVPHAKPAFIATRYANYEMEAQAAAQGIGVALLSPVLFADHIARGTLTAPFAVHLEGPSAYWLLWANDSPEYHFVRWLKAQFGIEAGAAGP